MESTNDWLLELKEKGQLLYCSEVDISPNLICPICTDPFVDAVQDEKEHTFCRACLEVWRQKSDSCPLGGENLSKVESAPRLVHNMVNELICICPNQCGFECERENLIHHFNGCGVSMEDPPDGTIAMFCEHKYPMVRGGEHGFSCDKEGGCNSADGR
jgi:hypothetical protein